MKCLSVWHIFSDINPNTWEIELTAAAVWMGEGERGSGEGGENMIPREKAELLAKSYGCLVLR